MKIAFIGGSHPRHLYYLNRIAARFDVRFALLQKRGEMIPEVPSGTHGRDAVLWKRHFKARAEKEAEYFGPPSIPATDYRLIDPGALNELESAAAVVAYNPDVVLIFGCGMIREPLAPVLPKHTYNLHLGLSPRYRGAATLFWPFYFLEPNWAGTTLHRIVSEPDAGEIAAQSRPPLKWGDTLHDVSCRAVVEATEDVLDVLDKLEQTGDLTLYPQQATGKNFLASDFQPAHLRQIYETFDDDIVDAYLSGELQVREPKLRTQLWRRVAHSQP